MSLVTLIASHVAACPAVMVARPISCPFQPFFCHTATVPACYQHPSPWACSAWWRRTRTIPHSCRKSSACLRRRSPMQGRCSQRTHPTHRVHPTPTSSIFRTRMLHHASATAEPRCKAKPASLLRPDPPELPEDCIPAHAPEVKESVALKPAPEEISMPEPPHVRAPWAQLTEEEREEQLAREEQPEHPWHDRIEGTPDALRRNRIRCRARTWTWPGI